MNPNMGWRWTEYLVALMGFVAFGLDLIFLEETYPPVVLVEKAVELRRRTKNWGIHALQDEIEVDVRRFLSLSSPFARVQDARDISHQQPLSSGFLSCNKVNNALTF